MRKVLLLVIYLTIGTSGAFGKTYICQDDVPQAKASIRTIFTTSGGPLLRFFTTIEGATEERVSISNGKICGQNIKISDCKMEEKSGRFGYQLSLNCPGIRRTVVYFDENGGGSFACNGAVDEVILNNCSVMEDLNIASAKVSGAEPLDRNGSNFLSAKGNQFKGAYVKDFPFSAAADSVFTIKYQLHDFNLSCSRGTKISFEILEKAPSGELVLFDRWSTGSPAKVFKPQSEGVLRAWISGNECLDPKLRFWFND